MNENAKPKANNVGAKSIYANKTKNIADAVGVDAHIDPHSKGITLIALIITIIVMLILAGVSIIIAINGGLFDTTKKAAKGTEDAKRKEQELASGRIKIDGIWYDSLEDYAIGKASAIQGIVDLDESNTKFKYTPEGWTTGEVKVEIDASAVATGFILKYSTDNINWKDYIAEIPMNTNGPIYAKLVDSDGKEGGAITANVGNIDKIAPTINTNVTKAGEETDTTISLSINVTDSNSGISKIKWYYKLEADTSYTTKEDLYKAMNGKEAGERGAVTKETTLTGLKPLSTYNIYVEVYDVAGNITRSPSGESTIDITTKEPAVEPQIGDYVLYEPDEVTNNYELLGQYSGHGDRDPYNYSLTTPTDQIITQEDLEWQILKMHEDGSIDLIGTPTANAVYFGGSLGYNNGVFLLHDMCEKLYSKESVGIYARSVSLEDFEDEDNGGNWKVARNGYTSVTKYNGTKMYTGTHTNYPNLYARENGSGINEADVKIDGIKDTDKGYESPTEETYSKADANKLTVTQTYYKIVINEANYGESAKVLSQTNKYWIASRFASGDNNEAWFGLRVAFSELGRADLFSSLPREWKDSYKIRPIITLSPSSKIVLSKEGVSGNPNTFEITKY